MTSECDTDNTEINDIFDAIACSEDYIVREAFEEGVSKGVEEAKADGYHVGFHKGAKIGNEIGYYEGIVDTVLKLYKDKEIDLSDKVLGILNKLKQLLNSFPHFNCSNTDIIKSREEIKIYFKQFCSLMKFKGTLAEEGLSF